MRKAIFISILALLLIIVGYVYWNYYFVVSEGYREGDLQKFSHKGNVFKTYEGEMVQIGFGARRNMPLSANYFYFSVADEDIADSLEKSMGKVVKLHYVQYRRSLSWRGDNYDSKNSDPGQYIVDRIESVRDADY